MRTKIFLFFLVWVLSFPIQAQYSINYNQNISLGLYKNPIKKYTLEWDQFYYFIHSEIGFSRAFFEQKKFSIRTGIKLHYERLRSGFIGADEYGEIEVKEISDNLLFFINNEVNTSLFEIANKSMSLSFGAQICFLRFEMYRPFIDTKDYPNYNDLRFGQTGKILINADIAYPIINLKNKGSIDISLGYGYQLYAESFFFNHYNYFRLGLNWKLGKKEKGS